MPAQPVGRPMGRMSGTDYSSAVSTFEETAPGEGEPEPVVTGSHKLIDLQLAAPMPRSTKVAIYILIVAGILGALGLGFGFGKVMRARQVANDVIDSAQRMLGQIQPISEAVGAVNSRLEAIPGDEYTPELQQVFLDFCGGSGQQTITVHHLSDARTLMTTRAEVTTALLEYTVQSQILVAICRQHLAKTVGDQAAIGRLQEAADQRNYGVVFELAEISDGWSAFTADPVNATYTPPQGVVVTYDNLDIIEQGEGDQRSFNFQVVYANVQRQVPLFNLIAIPREALVENASEETAMDRYRGRVQAIRAQVVSLIQLQTMLMEGLNELAGASRHFTL